MTSEDTYLTDAVSMQIRSYSNGNVFLQLYGHCHDIPEDWNEVLRYVTEDGRECAVDDMFRIIRGWMEFGPLGAAMELPVRA